MNPPLSLSTPEDAERHRLAWSSRPLDLLTPVAAFVALRAAGRRPCLLESVEGPARLARYSFLGVDPDAHFRAYGDGTNVLRTPDGVEERLPGSSLDALRTVAARRHLARPAGASPVGLPPFAGGWVGFVSYEWTCALEPRVARAADDPFGVPDLCFDHMPTVVAFDHGAQSVVVVTQCPEGSAGYAAACERVEAVAADLFAPAPEAGGVRLLDDQPTAHTARQDYLAGVDRLRHEISQGEIFQAVLSQRFSRRFEGDVFTLYRALRLGNPAPHMFFYEADGTALVGSSPERLVSVLGTRCQAVPIAGTRPRGATPDEDEAFASELRRDVKERAEHDMLVDLARNDLGRVARIGTVTVKEHAVLQRFQRVQHLVSRVEGDLAADSDALDALAATFPAGTVSGAPKIRAMELLSALEGRQRGPYAGAFGYLDAAGQLDVAITIRTLVVQGDTVHAQAGAGIVFDSEPEREFDETLHKSRALLEAVELASHPAFQPSAPRTDEAPVAAATEESRS